jgi:hypothetical protein
MKETETEKHMFDRFGAANYCGVSVVTIDRLLAKRKISCFALDEE